MDLREKIKGGLQHCGGSDVARDALMYIRQLECERDAAIKELTEIANQTGTCLGCRHWDSERPLACELYRENKNCWEWRGADESGS